ncbi:GTPase, G3E family [Desulfatibacillum alkenivorans DSM 16219]|jgi:G3E family GTPase|uniref:GTPase, G3E family n=1 Tax=Desulfatibacillum alkenivorans DSM 16219 TaxID=1121393 RepID=A0A1M6XPP3_9BACT|nr:GTP-binding protein [Desulfatibacillum alkenivorans]SHL07765.1 GTPase, G3E family [Desulfatibacillum alkenivorans DSM 16219]
MPTKIDIISGVLGAGKTTLINRILDSVLKTDKTAIIENEFGEIGIDGCRFAESGVALREISGGCICCTLFGDFVSAARQLISQVRPDRIIVEPTGVGKLTDVLRALEAVGKVEPIEINMIVAVIDPLRYNLYSKMFGEFFTDQIQKARTIFLSRTQLAPGDAIDQTVKHLKEINPDAAVVTSSWEDLTGEEMVSLGEKPGAACISPTESILAKEAFCHHHHADEVFKVWSAVTSVRYSREQFRKAVHRLSTEARYGEIARGKGVFQTPEGGWLHYDYVPGETLFQNAEAMDTGKLVFIGKELNSSGLEELFGLAFIKGV